MSKHERKVIADLERRLARLRAGLPEYPEPCAFTFAHTRHWCGNPDCRDS